MALEASERGRSRALVELLTQQLTINREVADNGSLNLEKYKEIAREQQSTVVLYSPSVSNDEPVHAYLEYSSIDIWAISPEGNVTFRQYPISQDSLASFIITTRQAIGILGTQNGEIPQFHTSEILDRVNEAYQQRPQGDFIARDNSPLDIDSQILDNWLDGYIHYISLAISDAISAENGWDAIVVPLIGSTESPNANNIRTLAQARKSTLVEYSIVYTGRELDDPQLYTWVISPDGNITFRQQPLTDIDLTELVTTTRQSIGVRGTRNVSNPDADGRNANAPYAIREEVLAQLHTQRDRQLTQLHDLLITPIADLLPTDPEENVIFIPQGELFLVPFPALKDSNGKYLLEKHTILTAPSIQVLELTRNIATERTPTNRNPLIVGNPTMPTVTFFSEDGNFEDFTLLSLPGAEREARDIADFLNASPLLGDAATEATVKQQIASADSIHLATHGLLEYGDPQQTGSRDLPGAIALASGGGEDGLLTSSEILQLDLQANLVVLSACDTGRGRITGDGVIGLSRAFVAAGVPSIVVSLWSVPDAPTAELMREFYAQLDSGQPKAQALRQAMLITMQTHPDPKDWAAFTLIGEGE